MNEWILCPIYGRNHKIKRDGNQKLSPLRFEVLAKVNHPCKKLSYQYSKNTGTPVIRCSCVI